MVGTHERNIKAGVPRCARSRTGDGEDAHLRELIENNARLEEVNQIKTKFVADISHELRTALHSLTMYVFLLEKGRSEQQAHYQAMLRKSIDHLVGFVEDTLDLAHLELNQGQDHALESTDLNALVRQAVALHQGRAECAGLQLTFVPQPNLPTIVGECRLLMQLITNLVVNAIKYTPRGYVQIVTTYLPTSHQVALTVSDSGLGIAPEDLPHIFERFYRARTQANKAIHGTGLGLAIVKEIVELHHGVIQVRSTPGLGSCFTVLLPAEHAPAAHHHRTGRFANANGVPTPGATHETAFS